MLNFIINWSNFEIWQVYMNFTGKFHLIFIYNKQSRPLIRELLKEPSDLGLLCLQRYINLFPALQGLTHRNTFWCLYSRCLCQILWIMDHLLIMSKCPMRAMFSQQFKIAIFKLPRYYINGQWNIETFPVSLTQNYSAVAKQLRSIQCSR